MTDFAPVPLRDNFYQTSAFLPMSFALVTTVHEDGTTGIGPHALCFPFGISKPHSMLLISRASSGTAGNIRRTGKCALNYLELDRTQLTAIARLGLPGQSLEDKQRGMPFSLMPAPGAGRAAEPDFPQVIAEAFQVMECRWDRSFELNEAPGGDAEAGASRFVLEIERLWLKEPYLQTLDAGGVRFTREACAMLTAVPKPFVKNALAGIVQAAKAEGITEVGTEFMQTLRSRT